MSQGRRRKSNKPPAAPPSVPPANMPSLALPSQTVPASQPYPSGPLATSPRGPDQAMFAGGPAPSDSTEFAQIGVAGLKVSGGRIIEEFLPQLRGPQGIRLYKEMSDNDATIGAILFTIEMLLRKVRWEAQPSGSTVQHQQAADFATSLMTDMEHSWEDFVSEAITNLIYGFSLFEIVYKRRTSRPNEPDAYKSKFDDNLIGIAKFAPRSQDTIWQWLYDLKGNLTGYMQIPYTGGGPYYVPIKKSLLFRTLSRKNNPEGRSILRNAYRSWYFLKAIQEIEAIAIERELAGLPVVSIPNEMLVGTDPQSVAARAAYEKLVRDVKLNEQGGVVIPSDPFRNPDGTYTSVRKVEFNLVSAGGGGARRQIDTLAVKQSYQTDIARSVMAQFLMLGGQRGALALSVNQTDMFVMALEAWQASIASVLNCDMLPRLWELNKFDPAYLPFYKSDPVADVNLGELGGYVAALAGAGMPLFPDPKLEAYLRRVAKLPPQGPDAEPLTEEADDGTDQG